jgi:PAS domain S-box-containing protein
LDGSLIDEERRPGRTVFERGEEWSDLVGLHDPTTGELRWLEVLAHPILDAERRVVEGVIHVADVTVVATEAARSDAVVAASPHGIIEADAATRRFTWCNEAMAAMFGCTVEELLTLGVEDLHPPEAVPMVGAAFERIAQGITDVVPQVPCRRRDGTLFVCDIHPGLVPIASEVRLVAFFTDVTERQRDRALLFAAEEIADIGSWELDWATSALEWSPQTYRIFARSRSAHPPTYEEFLATVHPDDRALVDESFGDAVARRIPYEVVHRILVDGAVRWVHERGRTEYGTDGTPRRSIGTVQHVTAQRDAQERLRATQTLEVLGRITSQLAHDVNNLLAVVSASVELARLELDDASADQPVSEHLRTALDACRRGGELTTRLLATARHQALEPSALDLRELLEGFLPVAHAVLGSKAGIELHLPDAPLPVFVDRSGFDTAMLNLITNARDAIAPGGRVVLGAERTTARPAGHPPRADADEFARVWVADNGSGIDAATIARVFEPFFTTKPPGDGTGLGLPMVVDFADRSGGTAILDSEVGVGTTVTIWLPLRR